MTMRYGTKCRSTFRMMSPTSQWHRYAGAQDQKICRYDDRIGGIASYFFRRKRITPHSIDRSKTVSVRNPSVMDSRDSTNWVLQNGSWHPVPPATIEALHAPVFFAPIAVKSRPPALCGGSLTLNIKKPTSLTEKWDYAISIRVMFGVESGECLFQLRRDATPGPDHSISISSSCSGLPLRTRYKKNTKPKPNKPKPI